MQVTDLDRVRHEPHPLDDGHVDLLVVVVRDREEEDESTSRLEREPGEADEVERQVGELVGAEGGEVY